MPTPSDGRELQAFAGGGRLSELRSGWPVLLGSALGTAFGIALFPLYLMPVLGAELVRVNGWHWAAWAFVLTLTSVSGLLGLLLSGRIVDAFGPRWPAVISTVAMGSVLAAAPIAHTLGAWRIGCVAFAIAGLATNPVGYARAVSDAFAGTRGFALGVTFGSVGLAGAIVPSVLIALAHKLGVQRAVQLQGLAYIFILAPLIGFLLRRTRHPVISSGSQVASILAPEITALMRRQRWRASSRSPEVAVDRTAELGSFTRARWIALTFGFVTLCTAAYGSAVSLPHLAQQLHLSSPAALMATVSLAVMISRPLSGLLMDFAPAQLVAALVAAATGAGLLVIAAVPRLLLLGAGLAGISLGAEVSVLAFLVSRHAAPARQSRIFARIFFLVNAAVAISPSLFAKAHSLAGGYSLVFDAAGAAALGAALLIGTLPAHVRPLPQGIRQVES